jgi:hypothetical protein
MSKNKQYRVSVYERIENAVINGETPNFENYKQELMIRGHGDGNEKVCLSQFNGYVKRVEYAWKVMQKLKEEGNLNPGSLSKEVVRIFSKTTPREDLLKFTEDEMKFRNTPSLEYKLTDEEKEIAKKAVEVGAYYPKKGEELTYKDAYTGKDKKVESFSHEKLPEKTDALVVFSGHNDTGNKAVEAFLSSYKSNGKFPKLFFLGLVDHQNNTAFGGDEFKYRVDSEAEMYRRVFKEHGIPDEIVDECIVTPNDVTTEGNAELLKTCIDRYLSDKDEVNIALIGYRAYEKRIASEFPKLLKGYKKDVNFIIADVPERYNGGHAVENTDGEGRHITFGGCLANIVRSFGDYEDDDVQRLETDLSKNGLDEDLRSLLTISTGHGWPNHLTENLNIDPDSAMLKWTMNKIDLTSRFEADPKVQDKQIELSVIKNKKKLIENGLLPKEIAEAKNLSAKDFFVALNKMHDDKMKRYEKFVKSKRIR